MAYTRKSDGLEIKEIGDPTQRVVMRGGVPLFKEQEVKDRNGVIRHATVPQTAPAKYQRPKRHRDESKYSGNGKLKK